MIDLELLKPSDLMKHDYEVLQRSIDGDQWNDKTAQEIVEVPGTMVYRVSGDASGILVLGVLFRAGKKSLFVRHLAGKGMLKRSSEIMDLLCELARMLDCKTLSCAVTRQGLVEHYSDRLGFTIESVNMVKEV